MIVALCVFALGLAATTVRQVRTGGTTSLPSAPTDGLPADSGPNPIQAENARPGTSSWTYPLAPAGAIEGYPSATSLRPGSTLGLQVSTRPGESYRIEVYRLGWYRGAGARLIQCLPGCAGEKKGTTQPVPEPAPTGELRAGWPVTDEMVVPPDAVSGYYVAKLVLTTGADKGKAASVPFIVQAPPTRQSVILVQAAVNTWQAYNNWGGKSLYDFNSSNGVPATRVSFDRPLVERAINHPFTWEYPLVRFLEREGYDVAYVSDVDTHQNPAQLRRHRLVMTAGHDEYWSKEMRDGFEAALAAGTSLAFMGANTANAQIRYDNAEKTIVLYRSAPADPVSDPARKTVRFRELQPPRPECQLLGVQSRGGLAAPGDPERAYMPTAAVGTDPWFRNTGLSESTVLRDLVGYEWDVVQPSCATPPLTVLFHYEGAPSNADAVRYTAPSGARVFSSGTLQFSWGLDDWGHPGRANQGLQQFMRNALEDLTGPPRR